MAGFDENVGRRDAALNERRGKLGTSPAELQAIDRRTAGSPNVGVEQYHGKQEVIPRRRQRPGTPNQFEIRTMAPSGSDWIVTIHPGYVIDRQPKESLVKMWMPTSGGTPLDTDPHPEITMSLGDSLYCLYVTDTQGKIVATPTITVESSAPTVTHYQPDDPAASGTTGVYYVKLFELADDGNGRPQFEAWQQSDIHHTLAAWEGENVGSGQEVYKDHDAASNTHRFREIDGRDSYSSDSPDAGTTEQIQVVTDSDTLRVLGNGHTSTVLFEYEDGEKIGKLEINDGLTRAYDWNGSGYEEGDLTVIIPMLFMTTS